MGDRVVGLDSRTIKRGCRISSSGVIGCQVLKVVLSALSVSVRCLLSSCQVFVGVSDLVVGVSD